MDPTPLTLELRPLHNGAYTQITLKGPVATVPRVMEVRHLLSMLWMWHGGPIDVALFVDGTDPGFCWLEVWEDVLGRVPGRHLDVRYLVPHNAFVPGASHER
jgi:hypothetical protein